MKSGIRPCRPIPLFSSRSIHPCVRGPVRQFLVKGDYITLPVLTRVLDRISDFLYEGEKHVNPMGDHSGAETGYGMCTDCL